MTGVEVVGARLAKNGHTARRRAYIESGSIEDPLMPGVGQRLGPLLGDGVRRHAAQLIRNTKPARSDIDEVRRRQGTWVAHGPEDKRAEDILLDNEPIDSQSLGSTDALEKSDQVVKTQVAGAPRWA